MAFIAKTAGVTWKVLLVAVLGGGLYVTHNTVSTWKAKDLEIQDLKGKLDGQQEKLDLQTKEIEGLNVRVVQQKETIAVQDRTITDQQEEISTLEASLRYMMVENRVAEVRVIAQEKDPQTGALWTEVEFIEIDARQGGAIGDRKQFRIEGDLLYVEYLVIKFKDENIMAREPGKESSLCVFRRLFGSKQKPDEGFEIDKPGARPLIYGRAEAMLDFETKIWARFWDIAHDRQQAEKHGIRAMHGEAPVHQLRAGFIYKLFLRASDGLSIKAEVDKARQTAN